MKGTSAAEMSRRLSRFSGSVVLGLLLTPLSACVAAPSGPVVALPNSYYLQPDRALQTELARRDGHRVLAQHVAAYAVSGAIVAGALGDVPQKRLYTNELPYTGGPGTRYFILDTSTGRLESGLDADAWHSRLKALGLPDDFAIYAVLPWQG
jgi:hypothetical protein